MKKSIKTIIYIAVVVIVMSVTLSVKAFVFGNYTVKGESMEPTFEDGDVVWADKLATPVHDDIILISDETNLVKRVVGMAGDKLWMERDNESEGSKWYLCRKKNGSDTIERMTAEKYGDSLIPRFDFEISTCHPVKNVEGHAAFDEESAFVVPDGHVYALGDNRTISKDSRDLGAFELGHVIGIVKAKGMTVVIVLIAAVIVLMAAFFIADIAKEKKAERLETEARAADSKEAHEKFGEATQNDEPENSSDNHRGA